MGPLRACRIFANSTSILISSARSFLAHFLMDCGQVVICLPVVGSVKKSGAAPPKLPKALLSRRFRAITELATVPRAGGGFRTTGLGAERAAALHDEE